MAVDLTPILALLVVIALGVGGLLWRSFLPAYATKKGENLATKEDISEITEEVERVKALYASDLQEIAHQNALLLEQLRSRQQLRMVALEKRLAVHQEAFTLWRLLVANAHNDTVTHWVERSQHFWERNCLYLAADARDAFNLAYSAAANHAALVRSHVDAEQVKANWANITKAGKAIVEGADLPSLHEREAGDATRSSPG